MPRWISVLEVGQNSRHLSENLIARSGIVVLHRARRPRPTSSCHLSNIPMLLYLHVSSFSVFLLLE